MSSAVEQVKARLGIMEVVSGYLKLERAGVNWKARCPFHNEKTPSFFISPTRQSYHCFGCNRGGDIINFVEEMEGLDFLGALKQLAERAGVPLEPLAARPDNSEKALSFRLLEVARDYYRAALENNAGVKKYLAERGLTAETIKDFGLGFAPPGWQNLSDWLRTKGFSDQKIIEVGLTLRSAKNASVYDRFRSRIMFPLADSAGRTIGFSGRVFGETEEPGGKYINTPETPLYQKGKVLYGFDRAKAEIRRAGAVVMVEGQIDLLMAHQAGMTNAVAVSGTALTTDHLTLLRRLTDNLIMAFDGDNAGVAASKRAIVLALGAGFSVRLVALPPGQDPADLIARDESSWRRALGEAKPVIDFLLDRAVNDWPEKLQLIHQVEAEVYPYLAALTNTHDRDHYVARVARLTQLPENGIREKIAASTVAPLPTAEKTSAERPSRRRQILEPLFGFYWSGREIRSSLETILGPADFAAHEREWQSRKDELTLAAELRYAGMTEDKLKRELQELLDRLQLDLWQAEIDDLRFRLGQAERQNREPDARELLAKLQTLYKKANDLKNRP